MPNYPDAIRRNTWEKHGERPSVKDFGAVGDARRYADGAITSGGTAFTSASALFADGAVGKAIVILGAGPASETLVTTIAAFVTANSVTLTNFASATVSGASFVYGTDDTPAFQQAVDTLPDGTQLELHIPKAEAYLTTSPVTIGTRKITLRMGGCTWYAASTLFSITASSPEGANNSGCVSIFGCGAQSSNISYLLKAGNVIQQTGVYGPQFKHLTFDALAAGNSAQCFNLTGNFSVNISELTINNFAVGINLNGTDTGTGRGSLFHLSNLIIREVTQAGIMLSHSVETNITHAEIAGVANNPTFAWGLIIDTDTSGVNINTLAMPWVGMVIRHTMATTTVPFGGPPEWIFANNVISDSMTTVGILLDVTLDGVSDPFNRAGRGYHFINTWSAFTQTDNDDTIRISGGQDISFTDFRCRVSRRHGVYINGGSNVRLINPLIVANNAQDAPNGAGIYLESMTLNLGIQIIGGRIGDAVESLGKQRWGIYIASTFASPLQIIGVDLRDNEIGGISGASQAVNIMLGNIMGPASAGNPLGTVNRLGCDRGRLELGDGAFYLAYKETFGDDNVGINFDIADGLVYQRPYDRFIFQIDNKQMLRFQLGDETLKNSVVMLSRPTDVAGLNNSVLNSSLDTDIGERFNIRGDGRLTWGDGEVVDVVFQRIATNYARFDGQLYITGKVGIGATAPEDGWDLKASAIQVTQALRLTHLASFDSRPLKASSLGDIVPAAVNLVNDIDGILQPSNGGVGAGNFTGTIQVLTSIGTSTVSLNYKDHSGNNASSTVVVGVNFNSVQLTFANGILQP